MLRSRILISCAVAVFVVVCIACISYCHHAKVDEQGGKPLFAALADVGYAGSKSDWIESLTDEQRALLEIAYESSGESEYREPLEDWASREIRARTDNDGDVVVILPDGAEFTMSGKRSDNTDDASQESASASSNGPANNSLKAPNPSATDAKNNSGDHELPSQQAPEDLSTDAESADVESAGEVSANNEEPPEGTADVGGMHLIVDRAYAKRGEDDVQVPVRVTGNPGILGLTFSLSYDDASLTLKSADNGEAFKDVLSLTHSHSLGTGCLFTWDGVEVLPSDVRDGIVLNLSFDVADDATLGIHPITVHVSSALTNDLVEVGATVEDGSVLVQ